MTSRSAGLDNACLTSASSEGRRGGRLGSFTILALSAWCGLVAGLLEAGIIVLRKRYFDRNHFYGMSDQFVWLVPLADLLIFAVLGLILAVVVRRGARGQWLAPRVLCTLALLPLFWAAFPRIFGAAGLLLMMGVAARLVPALERCAGGFARMARLSFFAAACLLVVLAAWCWAKDRIAEWREAARPRPPPTARNVLLIVLDTVGTGHLSLLGYDRPTSPTIDELASRGICFQRAQATASWTLPSHASMFTGRWPHELSAGWFTPLDAAFPTVAEYLGECGYATAGFVANCAYCSSDSGLARGFTTYRDFIFPQFTALYLTAVVARVVDGIQGVESVCTYGLGLPGLRTPADLVWRLFGKGRKDSAVVNREFLDWLSERQRSDRPFFAFLNFYDAHDPYDLPATGIHRFGAAPRNDPEKAVLQSWAGVQKRGMPSQRQIAFARDSYDDCVADLDERLGELIDELQRRAVLERTWVIITADHGESFGEHPGVFLHGTTLYQTETHVPLVVIPPGGLPSPKVVTEPVSLRDLAATIVDAAGFKAESFPGDSLARFWDASSGEAAADRSGQSPAFSELSPETLIYSNNPVTSIRHWPVAALVEGDWSYTRREGDLLELLFNLREDPGELRNLANDPTMRPTLERMRAALGRLTAGPLTPDRFKP